MSRSGRTWATLLVGAVLAAVSWLVWMGWDDEYQLDPATGNESGPYEAWQVIGSGLCFVAVVLVVALLARPAKRGRVATVIAGGYTLAYAATVIPSDESGLAGVGVLMVAVGTWCAAYVLCSLARLPGDRVRSRHG